jgi:hypothetical protein
VISTVVAPRSRGPPPSATSRPRPSGVTAASDGPAPSMSVWSFSSVPSASTVAVPVASTVTSHRPPSRWAESGRCPTLAMRSGLSADTARSWLALRSTTYSVPWEAVPRRGSTAAIQLLRVAPKGEAAGSGHPHVQGRAGALGFGISLAARAPGSAPRAPAAVPHQDGPETGAGAPPALRAEAIERARAILRGPARATSRCSPGQQCPAAEIDLAHRVGGGR